MLLAVPAVDEVRVWFPDVVDELVTQGKLRHVIQEKRQSLVLPSLPEIHLHGVGLTPTETIE